MCVCILCLSSYFCMIKPSYEIHQLLHKQFIFLPFPEYVILVANFII